MDYTAIARELKLHRAGQDMLSDAFSGNVKGMGPGSAEMEFEKRGSEPVLIFMADKTSSGDWNMPLYKIFTDPFNTIGLVIAENMHAGFSFEVHEMKKHPKMIFDAPEEIYDMLALIGAPGRYAVKAVRHRPSGEIAAVSSTDKLYAIAGKYVGKDDPVLIVRSQGSFPAVGEVLEPFAFPQSVQGWMRGSHFGPLMPCSVAQSNIAADYLRRHGPFEPHRLPLEEMEYTTMPKVMKKLRGRCSPIS